MWFLGKVVFFLKQAPPYFLSPSAQSGVSMSAHLPVCQGGFFESVPMYCIFCPGQGLTYRSKSSAGRSYKTTQSYEGYESDCHFCHFMVGADHAGMSDAPRYCLRTSTWCMALPAY